MAEPTKTLDEIWAGDHLGRRDEAVYLSKYLAARYEVKAKEEGFVLAINGDWGMGKSFMLHRWGEQMHLEGHPVVQFDAWANDYTPEPLVAFIAELDKALGPQFDTMPGGAALHAQWYEKAKAVLIPGLKTAGFALAKHGLGMGAAHFSEVWSGDDGETNEAAFDSKALGEKLNKVVEDALKSHSNTKEAIKAFKERLGALIDHLANESNVQLPICVFIDELDRCRPDYAIQLLEGIKHLFGVPGLHFVIATNIPELAHSVRAVYGSGFSADRYLKRFFDMEYALPIPDGTKFAVELMSPLAESVRLDLITGLEHAMKETEKIAKGLPYIFERYATAFALPLRDQQQVARILDAAFLSLGGRQIQIHFLMFLAMLYQKNANVYHKVTKALNLSQQTGFQEIFPQTGEGDFKVPTTDSRSTTNSVSVTQISEVFFNILNGTNNHGQISDQDFPASLSLSFARSGGAAAIGPYMDIVCRAGRFAK